MDYEVWYKVNKIPTQETATLLMYLKTNTTASTLRTSWTGSSEHNVDFQHL